MNILVVGSSGKTGQAVLKKLSQTTHSVTGLIRSLKQEDLIKQYNATVLLGDLTGDVSKLAVGFDAIIFVAGSGGKNIQGVDYQGLVNVVNSAVSNNLKRFLYIGSINTGKEPKQFIQELKDYYQQNNDTIPDKLLANTQKPGYHNYVKLKTLAEKHLIESGLNYTILRAGLLTQEPSSGKVNVTSGTLNAFGEVSRENIAQCFISILKNKNTDKKIYTVLDGETPIAQAF